MGILYCMKNIILILYYWLMHLFFIIMLVELSFIFKRHGNLLSDVKLAYNLENKHTIIGWSFKNLFIFHNGKLKVKSYEPPHVC
jgi:hypothetical protein